MERGINFHESHHSFSSSSEFDDCPFTPLHPIQWSILCIFPTFILTSSSLPSIRHIDTPAREDQVLRRREVGIGTSNNGGRLEGGTEVDRRYFWAWKGSVGFRRWDLSICSESRLPSAYTLKGETYHSTIRNHPNHQSTPFSLLPLGAQFKDMSAIGPKSSHGQYLGPSRIF
jgi:hypothetical protein